MRLSLLLFLLTCAGHFIYAQGKISYNEVEQVVEFLSPEGIVKKRIDLLKNSRYANLEYPSNKKDFYLKYEISQKDRSAAIQWFFSARDSINFTYMNPVHFNSSSRALIQWNYAIVFDNLYLSGNGGTLGIKSIVTIYNEEGNLVATLPENNDGYLEASITRNGKYFAALYGDVMEIEYTLVPSPGFRLFDLRNSSCLVDIRSGKFDVYPVAVADNILIEVLRYSGGEYQYHFYDTDSRMVYKRNFSADEIGKFSRITNDGICIKEGRDEKMLTFKNDFTCANF